VIKLSWGAALAVLGSMQPAFAEDAPPPGRHPVMKALSSSLGPAPPALRAIDSPSPVQVLDAATLERAGPPSLMGALATSLPSLNMQAVGNDLANETLAARLRGSRPTTP
jgi:iron complex outermembrane receptor protein